jgi:hypothetical protein
MPTFKQLQDEYGAEASFNIRDRIYFITKAGHVYREKPGVLLSVYELITDGDVPEAIRHYITFQKRFNDEKIPS